MHAIGVDFVHRAHTRCLFRREIPGGPVNAGTGSAIDARILYMETLPLAEVRANLSKLVDEAMRTHQRVEVTRQGRRAAVLLSADDYDSIMETLDILSDAAAMAALREADADVDAGRLYSADEVEAELRAKGIVK